MAKAVNPNPLPGYLGGNQPMVFPQEMPGQLNAIGNQLAAGYGGKPATYVKAMDALYAPTNVPFDYKPATPGKPAAASSYTQANFPWQQYLKAFPALSQGGHATLGAEGARAWQHYLAQGGKWKPAAAGALAPNVPGKPVVGGLGGMMPNQFNAPVLSRGGNR